MPTQLPSGRWRATYPPPAHRQAPNPAGRHRRPQHLRRRGRRAPRRGRGARPAAHQRPRRRHRPRVLGGVDHRPAVAASGRVHQPPQPRAHRAVRRPLRPPARSAPSTTTLVREYRRSGRNDGTIPALRAMFNDAARADAGRLVAVNPFANLRIQQSRGRRDVQPPAEAETAHLVALADDLTPPSFAAYLDVAIHEGTRPGELDALMWTDLDFTPGAETIRDRAPVERQGAQAHAPQARRDPHDRDDPAGARPAARAAARVRVGVHDAARSPLHAELALRTTGTVCAARPVSATWTCTPPPAITSRGTRGTCSGSRPATSRSTSATRTAASWCASSTATSTRRGHATVYASAFAQAPKPTPLVRRNVA